MTGGSLLGPWTSVRTKKADYLHLDAEENPALGYRAIRICLDRTDVFRTQLRALLRAAVHGNLSIMYPMNRLAG